MSDRIYGPYEAAACVSQTYTDLNGTCTQQIAKAREIEISKGARCETKVEHFMFQNTGRFNTLWTLVCEGYILKKDVAAEGEPVVSPEAETTVQSTPQTPQN